MINKFFAATCLGLLVIMASAPIPALAIDSVQERAARKARAAAEAIPQGDIALLDQKWDEAIAIFSKIINAKGIERTTLGQVYFKRGLAFKGKGDCTSAVPDFDHAAEILTDNAEVLYHRSRCREALGQPDQAFADLNEAIKLNPDSAIYRVDRCTILFNKRDYAGAIPDCEMALSVAPEDQRMLTAVAQAYEQTGNQAKALEAYRRLLKLAPGNAIASEGVRRLEGN